MILIKCIIDDPYIKIFDKKEMKAEMKKIEKKTYFFMKIIRIY